MYQLYKANVTDRQYCSINCVFFCWTFLLYKDLQTMSCLSSIHTSQCLTKYLHVVLVVGCTKQWHDRRQRPTLTDSKLVFVEIRTVISSFHLILVHSNSFAVQVFMCSTVYGCMTLIQITMKLSEFQKETLTVSVHFSQHIVTNALFPEQACCQVFKVNIKTTEIKASENFAVLYSITFSWMTKLK